ncbi:putative thiamine biosynthetic bifunctional enzyme [Sphaerosporella brunnea]|uniref:Putative thiamine biosynthetic bifunctional enzyme n=1 Tax=Sphaerosporella brunnea TaxID=1250544 RepID=A0A5J5EVQ9_9PEZI|nr:putative thiamine biosynthetic bifunctional enzyme [Sphaerosporella brunnea]
MSSPKKFDLSVYLVTDSSLLPPGATLVDHVLKAIRGGATIVQLREKKMATRDFIKLGRELHEATKPLGVPLLINDRVDVAVAVGCEGIHVGWDDCSYEDARKLLGDDKIIGLSVSNKEQAEKAAAAGCDYIGVGPLYATKTKPDHSPPLGTQGLRSLLEYIATLPGPEGSHWGGAWGTKVPAVAIGGINLDNLHHVMYQSVSPQHENKKYLSGIAVVSAIMASPEPEEVCKKFRKMVDEVPPFAVRQSLYIELGNAKFKSIFQNVVINRPIVHHITNNVVKNFSANVTLALGASPIMSEDMSEFSELAAFKGGLVLNMGTSTREAQPMLLAAVKAANAHGNPVVFDPVGAGATSLRRETASMVVGNSFCDVIKGNEQEIMAVYGLDNVKQRGVDSDPAAAGSLEHKITHAKALAVRERNIVVMTGNVDIVTDGSNVCLCNDGHGFMGDVTGTGCSLGSVIAACLAANPLDKFVATCAAVCAYSAAARVAAGKKDVHGPASWQVAFLDTLYQLRHCREDAPQKGYPWWESLAERVEKR